MQADILAFGPHPDDVELGCGGTILRQISLGHTVAIVDLTQGELGTRGSAALRQKEAGKAARLLGVTSRINLKIPDGNIRNEPLNQSKVIRAIRTFRPEIVLSSAVRDRHPDHARAADLINTACFLAGLRNVGSSTGGKKQEPWRPRVIYNYVQDYHLMPDFVVDVSEFFEKKLEAVMAYRSQFSPGARKGPQTPVSTQLYWDGLRARAIEYGRSIGVFYGEGFTATRPVGIADIHALI